MRRKHKIISDCAAFKPKEVMLKFPIIYICLSKKLYFSTAESKYSGHFLGELCCLYIIPQLFFFEN